MATDKNGEKLNVGDIVTATVKYRIEKIDGDTILAHKIYDVPQNVFELYERGGNNG